VTNRQAIELINTYNLNTYDSINEVLFKDTCIEIKFWNHKIARQFYYWLLDQNICANLELSVVTLP
jgi:hypothetical protein